MINQGKDEINSPEQETGELHIELAKLLNKVQVPSIEILTLMGDELFEEVNQSILEHCKQSKESSHSSISSAIEAILKLIVGKLETAKDFIAMDVTKKDYETLEETLQRKEAEIRNHFKLEMQQRLYESDLEENISQLQKHLDEVTVKIGHYQEKLSQLEKELKESKRKLEQYEQKFYQMSREGGWNSLEKKSSQKLIHKASLNFKNRAKVEPYLENLTKTKQAIDRYQEGSRLFKQRASRILCFESIKRKRESLERRESLEGLPVKKSVSQHNSKVMGRCYQDLSTSTQLGEGDKKKKIRMLRQATENVGRREKQQKSIYI